MSGILVISRPPGIFPPDLIPSLELELLNTGSTNLTMNPTTLAPLTDELETSGHKMVGIGVALLVPIFSAFLAILTRFTTAFDQLFVSSDGSSLRHHNLNSQFWVTSMMQTHKSNS